MTARPVVALPDRVLTTVAVPFDAIDDEAREVAAALLATMRVSDHSVGVAAPQIGVARRAFAFDVTGHPKSGSSHGEGVLLNPELLSRAGEEVAREGCMSVPHLTADVPRAEHVVVRGLTPEGTERTIEAVGFEARVLQHELDHLDGVLFLDRAVARGTFRRKLYR